MLLVCHIRILKKKPEQGFVLMATLFAMLILIAVSIFALTVTTQDIKASGGYYCERRSLSAADAAITAMCLGFDPQSENIATNVQISGGQKYGYSKPTIHEGLPSVAAIGSEMNKGNGTDFNFRIYDTSVTGDGGGCVLTFDVRLKHGPLNGPGYR
jgi:hypothetical protein